MKLSNGNTVNVVEEEKEVIEQNNKAKKIHRCSFSKKITITPNNKSPLQIIPSETISLKDIRLKLEDVNKLNLNYINTDPRFNKDWYITINSQKYYYTFDKKERIARYYKNGKLANLDIVKEYNKKHKVFENLKKEGKHYIFKVTKAQKVIDREFSDLGGMYFRMQRADKSKVKTSR